MEKQQHSESSKCSRLVPFEYVGNGKDSAVGVNSVLIVPYYTLVDL